MIIEIDTTLSDNFGDLTMSQLVFLSCVLNDNQKTNQSVTQLLSRVSEQEIQGLIDNELITTSQVGDKMTYKATKKVKDVFKTEYTLFDKFYEAYPVYVTRPDGITGFLRSNVNKCRKLYNQIVGKSKAQHDHIMNCLNYELSEKTMTGKLCYMKTMWKWLVNHEWESIEEQMNNTTQVITPKTFGSEFF